jgi:transcriptional regulator with XRE-family HTH domain
VIGGELVREARKRAGLSQAELAARAGTTQSAIARLESGRTSPALEQVERLLRLCGFQLIVQLTPYDDSDIVQAEAQLRRSPEARARRLATSVNRMRAVRADAHR